MNFTSGKDGETWIIQHDEVFMLGGGGAALLNISNIILDL